MQLRLTPCAAALLLLNLAGCASMSVTTSQMKSTTGERASSAIAEFDKSTRPAAAVREVNQALVDFKKTEQPRFRGEVNLHAASAPFGPILSELGKKAGYSVAYSDSVDVNRKVTVDFNDAMTEDAIRSTAFLVGYAAVIDKQNKTIMVSDVAMYTFKIPAGLLSTLEANYTVGGNPANSASSSSSGGAGGAGGAGGGSSSPGGTSLRAEFSVKGKEGSNPVGLTRFLQDLAGKNAEVYVTDSGYVSVKANAQALRRVHEFMRSFVKDAMTQVEIEASVVEVSLTKDFSLGIQWSKVVNTASQAISTGGGAGAALTGALTGSGPGALLSQLSTTAATGALSAYKVGVSSASLLSALAQFTDINIVSQPKLLSMNNVPATFFDGTQIPYLGSVQQTQSTAAGGAPTVTGSVAFAIDGVSFSAIPSVVDGSNVQITLIPVLSNVSGFSSFLNNTLTAPVQGNKQTYMRVLAESGKTLILGGIRYNKTSKDTNVLSSLSSTAAATEVVILLRANIIPSPTFELVVSESL